MRRAPAPRLRVSLLLALLLTLGGGAAAVGPPDPDPRDADGAVDVGARLIREGRYAEGIATIKPALAAHGMRADALTWLGFAHRRSGDLKQGEDYYRKALALDPDYRPANEYLGRLFLQRGDAAAAEAQLRRLERICGADCPEATSLRAALAAWREGRPFE